VTPSHHGSPTPLVQHPRALHELAPGLALAPVSAHPVSRTLEEGDLVGRFEVLEVPGHSPGAFAVGQAAAGAGGVTAGAVVLSLL
jgi:glyoxylase-like metal-dependent hydrolase (beta-lactamase superfamily II)